MPTTTTGAMSQDWEPVVLHKTRPKTQVLRAPKAVNQALRAGAQVQTLKKFDGGTNKKAPATAVYATKLDEAAEPAALGRVAPEVRQLMLKCRRFASRPTSSLKREYSRREELPPRSSRVATDYGPPPPPRSTSDRSSSYRDSYPSRGPHVCPPDLPRSSSHPSSRRPAPAYADGGGYPPRYERPSPLCYRERPPPPPPCPQNKTPICCTG